MSATHPQVPQPSGIKPAPAYEFSKRKRWADLLLSELVDNVVFVLSPTCKVWYCGAAVTEVLGWRDADLLDFDFIDFIDSNDQSRFRIAFDEAMENCAEFSLSIRLKGSDSPVSYPSSSSSTSTVFEIKCYPYIGMESENLETKCLIAMVAPYPSRNTAMLHTILDLKAQNDRLQRAVADHRERAPAESPTTGQSPLSQAGSMYATSSLHPTKNFPASGPATKKATELLSTYLSSSNSLSRSLELPKGSAADAMEYANGIVTGPSSSSANTDQSDEGSKKKKLKRMQNAEQYVCITCGRTDSPEWRKGPLGPKTLCNACGLRWAKQMRKVDDPDGTVASVNAADEG